MSEFPPPIRLPGQATSPREPSGRPRHSAPAVVDRFTDLYAAAGATTRLTARLERLQPGVARRAEDGRIVLSPPFAEGRDRVEGPPSPRATLVVFGAHGTPWSRDLGRVLDAVRERRPSTIGAAWRHFPDPAAHEHAAPLALAVEAAAEQSRFWALTRELLRLRHFDSFRLHTAVIRAGLDPERTVEAMRTGAGDDRVVADVESALASAVISAPALFVNGERYRGRLAPAEVLAALESV
jgi:hypothetical protein